MAIFITAYSGFGWTQFLAVDFAGRDDEITEILFNGKDIILAGNSRWDDKVADIVFVTLDQTGSSQSNVFMSKNAFVEQLCHSILYSGDSVKLFVLSEKWKESAFQLNLVDPTCKNCGGKTVELPLKKSASENRVYSECNSHTKKLFLIGSSIVLIGIFDSAFLVEGGASELTRTVVKMSFSSENMEHFEVGELSACSKHLSGEFEVADILFQEGRLYIGGSVQGDFAFIACGLVDSTEKAEFGKDGLLLSGIQGGHDHMSVILEDGFHLYGVGTSINPRGEERLVIAKLYRSGYPVWGFGDDGVRVYDELPAGVSVVASVIHGLRYSRINGVDHINEGVIIILLKSRETHDGSHYYLASIQLDGTINRHVNDTGWIRIDIDEETIEIHTIACHPDGFYLLAGNILTEHDEVDRDFLVMAVNPDGTWRDGFGVDGVGLKSELSRYVRDRMKNGERFSKPPFNFISIASKDCSKVIFPLTRKDHVDYCSNMTSMLWDYKRDVQKDPPDCAWTRRWILRAFMDCECRSLDKKEYEPELILLPDPRIVIQTTPATIDENNTESIDPLKVAIGGSVAVILVSVSVYIYYRWQQKRRAQLDGSPSEMVHLK